jgi:cysteine synthase A
MKRHNALPPASRLVHLVGNTPLVPVRLDGGPEIWCKCEFLNPSGSTKDRIARYMLEKAWRCGEIAAGGRVIEASSGSTSIALALACAQMGLRFTAVLPEGVSDERVWIIKAYGGDVHIVPRAEGIVGAMRWAADEAARSGAFAPRQFENPNNAEAHRLFTAAEILQEIPHGVVDAVVSGVGTGGTLVGLFEGLDGAGCSVTPVHARPVSGTILGDAECCAFSKRVPGVVEGMSHLFMPERMAGLVTMDVPDEEALSITRKLIGRGFPVGPSSGLNFAAAVEMARRLGDGACVVTVFPDRMERYFSTELFTPIKSVAAAAV